MAVAGGVPKEEFLRSIRQALGREGAPPTVTYPQLEETLADLEIKAAAVRMRLAEDPSSLIGKLAHMAGLGGWKVHQAGSYEEAIEYVASMASAIGAGNLVRTDQPIFRYFPVDTALENLGLTLTTVKHDGGESREFLRERIVAADIGLTGADYAVAETGSVVVVPRKGLSRLVSLVPPVHIALVRPQDVVDTMDDLFLLRRIEYYQQGGDMGSYLNFITGPSRTADIEQTLVVGVHGPKEAHLVFLD